MSSLIGGSGDGSSRRLVLLAGLVSVVCAAWALRFLIGGELPPGNDITGHLQRTARGLELFADGRLDGWYPDSMLGYQLFLFYGPGLTALLGLVRLASFGALSDAGALELVLAGAYVAMPLVTARLARALGLRPLTAAAAGILALAAGSTRGGGIEGAFATGLAAQQVAVPMVVLGLALVVERVDVECSERRGGPVPLALLVSALALTHPLSLVLFGLLVPLVLAAVWVKGTFDRSGWRELVVAAVVTVGLSAWWWLPALANRDLRGPVTSFDLPAVWDHVELLVTGERGWRGIAGPVATLGVVVALVDGAVNRNRRLLSLALLPLAAFATLHAAHGLLGIDDDVGRQLPNRGLVFVAILAAPVLAREVESWLSASGVLRRWVPDPPAAALTYSMLGVVSMLSLTTVEIGVVDRYRPDAEIEALAGVVAEEVPAGGRLLWIDGDEAGSGVPDPQRWLAWRADRSSLSSFGPEYAPGSGDALRVSGGPGSADAVEGWLAQARALGATLVATGNEDEAAFLTGASGLSVVWDGEDFDAWRIEEIAGAPLGSPLPVPGADVVVADDERVVVHVSVPEAIPVELAIGWSPGWSARIDQRSVELRRSDGDRLELDLPAGHHAVELAFEEPPVGVLARVVSATILVVVLAWTVGTRRRDRRRRVGRSSVPAQDA